MALSYELEVGLLQPHLFPRNAFFFRPSWQKENVSQVFTSFAHARHVQRTIHHNCIATTLMRNININTRTARCSACYAFNTCMKCLQSIPMLVLIVAGLYNERNTRIFFRQKFGKNFCRNLIRTKRCCRSLPGKPGCGSCFGCSF